MSDKVSKILFDVIDNCIAEWELDKYEKRIRIAIAEELETLKSETPHAQLKNNCDCLGCRATKHHNENIEKAQKLIKGE